MKDRISALMKSMGMSQKNFAEEICISPGSLSSILSGRNNPSLNTLNYIHERFPEVNMDWLLNGNGEMFVSAAPVSPQIEANEAGQSGAFQQSAGLPIQPGFMEHLASAQQVAPPTSNFASDGKIFDKPSRRIAEIRVFYDDGTFETFSAKQ
ncbi:MAG: helix-turn-helix transcriptional regulator [Bacteroidaceae bacterium]|nr:helix-turn-helix transcriptional regulator [Bacteroidaceae bacterium]